MSQPDRITQAGQESTMAQHVVRELSQKATLAPDVANLLVDASNQRIDTIIADEMTFNPPVEDLGFDLQTLNGTEAHYRQLLSEGLIEQAAFGQLLADLNPQFGYARQRQIRQSREIAREQQIQARNRSLRWLPLKAGVVIGYGLILATTVPAVFSARTSYDLVDKELKTTAGYARVSQLDRSASSLASAGEFLSYSAPKRENDKDVPAKFPNPDYAKKQLQDAKAVMGDLGDNDELIQLIIESLPDTRGELKQYGDKPVNGAVFTDQRNDLDKIKKQIKLAQEEVKLTDPQPWDNLKSAENELIWAWLKFGISAIPGAAFFLRKLGANL